MSILSMQENWVPNGVEKVIDEAAQPLIFDNLQRSQYNYPIPSTIRELVCNAADSINEREAARDILIRNEPVSKYYVEKDGAIYKDSKFDPLYYDFKHLSTDPDVTILYKEGKNGERDRLIISDNGVGLGGNRLAGYFKLGYSTKRLSTIGIGKWGLGAKAPLSTNVSYYTVESRYNGRLYRFNIYSYKVESIIPPFDENGIRLGEEEFHISDTIRMKVNYMKTDLPNGVQVIVEAKKHQKDQYINAVKAQLLYFQNIQFFVEAATGQVTSIPVQADILYEDDYIILSDNNQYSKPHVLIKRVNYGYVDFQELELEDKMGNIGIKVEAEEVDVTPSRESIQWTEITRETINRKFRNVVDIAQNIIDKQLVETDFLTWLITCASLKASLTREGDNKSIIGRLAGIVDLNKLNLKYNPDKEFSYGNSVFAGIFVRFITKSTERVRGSDSTKLVRTPVRDVTAVCNGKYPFYYQEGRMNPRKDRYILENMHPEGFVVFQLSMLGDEEDEEGALSLAMAQEFEKVRKTFNVKTAEEVDEHISRLRKYVKDSKHARRYADIIVPEHINYKKVEKMEEEEDTDREVREDKAAAVIARREPGDIVFYTPVPNSHNRRIGHWDKVVVAKSSIGEWETPEVFYAYNEPADMATMEIASIISDCTTRANPFSSLPLREQYVPIVSDDEDDSGDDDENEGLVPVKPLRIVPSNDDLKKTFKEFHWHTESCPFMFGDEPVRLVRISKTNYRYFRDFRHINNFFVDIRKNTITMSSALIRWNTARILRPLLEHLKFLENFEGFDKPKFETYHTLKGYVQQYFKDLGALQNKDAIAELEKHCDRIMELQLFVQQDPTPDAEAISKLAINLFGAKTNRFGTPIEIVDGCAIDINLYNQALELVEWAEPVKDLLNEVNVLCNVQTTVTPELEQAVREYFNLKNFAL